MNKSPIMELGLGKSKPFVIRAMNEAASMVSLVHEAQATNYWSDSPRIRHSKREKAREKKRWAKIRRKQGR